MDDLYRIADQHKAAVLIGLDLSAAFDTIDHKILIQRLRSRFGISGVVLEWIRSYLHGRTQFVKVNENRSSITTSEVGVPQGFFLGPLLFSVYVSPIAEVISSFEVLHHRYADDTYDDKKRDFGNCFKTREQAEQARDDIKKLLDNVHRLYET